MVPLLLFLCACAPERAPSVILVSLDTMRADRLGSRDAAGHPRTPALDAFAAEARVFSRAYAASNETLYSHASLFLSRYPSEIGQLDYAGFHVAPDAPTLAAELSRAGWATEAVVAGGHLGPSFGLWAGFQQYYSMTEFGCFAETVPMALDRLEALSEGERPFLLLVHGYDAHTPYVRPGPLHRLETPGYDGLMLDAGRSPFAYENIFDRVYYPTFRPPVALTAYGSLFPTASSFDALEWYARHHPEEGIPLAPEDLAFIEGAYNGAVSLADFQVGRLLQAIDRLDLRENTWVIVFSDHGEDLGAHRFYNHRVSLHDENNAVILAIRGPGIEPGVVEDPVGLVDILPTVLQIAGLQPSGPVRGRSLFDPDPERGIYSESMRGTVSLRTRDGRVILPRDTPGPDGFASPQAWVGDDDNEAIRADDPRIPDLVRRLEEAIP